MYAFKMVWTLIFCPSLKSSLSAVRMNEEFNNGTFWPQAMLVVSLVTILVNMTTACVILQGRHYTEFSSNLLLTIFGDFDHFDHFSLFFTILDHLEPFWTILDHFYHFFSHNFYYFSQFWTK